MKKTLTLAIAAVALLALGSLHAAPGPADAAPPAQSFTIKAHKYAFEPSRIEVVAGTPVTLTLVAEDRAHGFICKGLGIAKVVFEPGKNGTVSFTAEKPGTYEFRCAKWCGFGHGRMRGEIVVREK